MNDAVARATPRPTALHTSATEQPTLPETPPVQHAAVRQWSGESALQLKQDVDHDGTIGAEARTCPDATDGKRGALHHVAGFFGGIKDGAVDTVKGLGSMAVGAWNLTAGWATNPTQAQKSWDGLKETVRAVADDPKALVTAVTKPITDAWKQGDYGRALGRGTFEVAGLVLGAKGVDKLAKSAKVADALADAGKLAKGVASVAPEHAASTALQKGAAAARPLDDAAVAMREAHARVAAQRAAGATDQEFSAQLAKRLEILPQEPAPAPPPLKPAKEMAAALKRVAATRPRGMSDAQFSARLARKVGILPP